MNEIRRGSLVVDRFGDRGIVVKIVKGTSHEEHGTIYVWQMDRMEYGADNCEHYPEFCWQDTLTVVEP